MMSPLRPEPHSAERQELPEASLEIPEEQRSSQAGQRLAAARIADREWRHELVPRIHRRLGKLRQSEKLIRRCGRGITGALALVAMGLAAGDGSMEPPMSLMLGAFAVSLATTVLIATIAWIHDHTRHRIRNTGLEVELPPATEEAYRKEHPDRSEHDAIAELLGPIVLVILGMLLLILIRVMTSLG